MLGMLGKRTREPDDSILETNDTIVNFLSSIDESNIKNSIKFLHASGYDNYAIIEKCIISQNPSIIKTLINHNIGRSFLANNAGKILHDSLKSNDNNAKDLVEILLECKIIDNNFRSSNNESLLMMATDNKDLFNLFLKYDASIHAIDFQDNTVLMHAVKACNNDIINYLLKQNINLDLINKDGDTALTLILNTKSNILYNFDTNKIIEISALFAEHKDISVHVHMKNQQQESFMSILEKYEYISNNDKSKIKELFKIRDQSTPHILKTINFLEEKNQITKATIDNILNKHKKNPLILAVENNDEVLVLKYLNLGVDINAKDKYKKNALMHAIILKQINIMKILLNKIKCIDKINDINTAHDKTGDSALSYAAKSSYEIFQTFLNYTNSDLNSKDGKGLTSLMHAIKKTKTDNVNLVLSYTKIQLDAQDNIGNTYLHLAAKSNKIIMQLLLQFFQNLPSYDKAKETINIRNNHGNTCLHIAADKGNKEIVKQILADPNITSSTINHKNNKGDTCIHQAARRPNEDIKALKILLKEPRITDETINALNNDCNTCLHITAKYGHTNTLQALLNSKRIKDETLNNQNNEGDTCLHISIKETGIDKQPEILLNTNIIDVNIKNNNEENVLAILYSSTLANIYSYQESNNWRDTYSYTIFSKLLEQGSELIPIRRIHSPTEIERIKKEMNEKIKEEMFYRGTNIFN